MTDDEEVFEKEGGASSAAHGGNVLEAPVIGTPVERPSDDDVLAALPDAERERILADRHELDELRSREDAPHAPEDAEKEDIVARARATRESLIPGLSDHLDGLQERQMLLRAQLDEVEDEIRRVEAAFAILST